MDESPSSNSPPPSSSAADASEYWCYNCNKRVSIETLENQPDVVCIECKQGFVELIPSLPSASEGPDDPSFGSHFLQMLRLISNAAREDNDNSNGNGNNDDDVSPPPPPSPPPRDSRSEEDFLRIEIDPYGEDHDDDDDDDDDDEYDNNDEDDDNNAVSEGDERGERSDNEEDEMRRRRDILRLRIRDFATRARSGRNRILDWAEILMGLEDNSIEFHLEVPEPSDRYVGNPEDYVDAAEFEALLQNLAESGDNGRRGAPPASKKVVSGLPVVEVMKEADTVACAVCKDVISVGEFEMKMPCGHGYHGDCIMPWLGSRNSCPVCRFELPTDDVEYELERKRRVGSFGGGASGSSAGDS